MNENITKINYYPGHMAKTKRQILENINLIDIVYVVVDARCPVSTMIKDINEIIKYFKRYANPINMFLLPKDIGWLGEIQEFIDEQKPLNIDKSVL